MLFLSMGICNVTVTLPNHLCHVCATLYNLINNSNISLMWIYIQNLICKSCLVFRNSNSYKCVNKWRPTRRDFTHVNSVFSFCTVLQYWVVPIYTALLLLSAKCWSNWFGQHNAQGTDGKLHDQKTTSCSTVQQMCGVWFVQVPLT